jgi:hypothetical protein
MSETEPPRRDLPSIRRWPLWVEVLALGVVLVVSFAVRWPFRNVVLIRDEGEYAYLGQQILRGAVPYLEVYNQKTPLVFYLMAAIQKLDGPDLAVLRIATAGYGLLTTLMTYFLARRLFNPAVALGSSVALSAMTFDQCGIHHSASTEFFMLLWIVVGLDLWYLGRSPRRPWVILLAGVAAGLAYQTKQSGMAILAFFVLERFWHKVRQGAADSWYATIKDAALAVLGFGGILGGVLAFFAAQGAASQYVECTWTNNWEYVSRRYHGPSATMELIQQVVVTVARQDAGLWLSGVVGVACLAFLRPPGKASELWLLLALLGGAAVGAGAPFVHYYEPIIVPLALGNGWAMAWLCRQVARTGNGFWLRCLLSASLIVPWIWPVAYWRSLLVMTEAQRSELNEVFPPFAVAPQVARYLAEHTDPDECILILGSEPETYYYAERRACTRLVFTFPMLGPYAYAPRLWDEFQRDFHTHSPRYVALAGISLSEWPEYLYRFLPPVMSTLRRAYVPDRQFEDAHGVKILVMRHKI